MPVRATVATIHVTFPAAISLALIAVMTGRAEAAATATDIEARRLDANGLNIDGIADEPVWQAAPEIHGLTSLEPIEGLPPAAAVSVRVFYDAKALYVAARITMPPGDMRGQLIARERWNNDDSFEVILDPFLDHRTGYDFGVNPYGSQIDWTIVYNDWSTAWDGVWDSAAVRYDDGFAVEMRIPFRTMRFPSTTSPQDWGIGFGFSSGAKKQYDTWPAMSADTGVIVSQLGTLRGVVAIDPPGKLDLIPTLVAGYGGNDASGVFAWDRARIAGSRQPGLLDPGLDVRYGLSAATNLNLTLNPDFSQVEADPDQLTYNLRYPVFLDEKRSFFLEGATLYTTPVNLLYTRSIVAPVVGGKLSGREGAWTFAVLTAWDQLPLSSQLVETKRMTGFEDLSNRDAVDTIARISYELNSGSRIGVLFGDKSLYDRAAGRFDAHNAVGSLDLSLAFGGIYTAAAQIAGSLTSPVGGGGALRDVMYDVAARRHDKNITVEISSQYYGEDFRAETSPLTRVGIAPSKLAASYRVYTGAPVLPFVEPGVALTANNEAGSWRLLDYTAGPTLATRIGSNADLTMYYRRGQETFEQRFSGIDVIGLTLSALPTHYLALALDANYGDQINYDRADLFLGTTTNVKLSTTLRFTDRIALDLRTTRSLLWRPDGTRKDDVSLYYGKMNVGFTTRWSLRLLSQYDSFARELSDSALLTYSIYPGTEGYIGYQEIDMTGEAAHARDRRVFLKCSYRWQL